MKPFAPASVRHLVLVVLLAASSAACGGTATGASSGAGGAAGSPAGGGAAGGSAGAAGGNAGMGGSAGAAGGSAGMGGSAGTGGSAGADGSAGAGGAGGPACTPGGARSEADASTAQATVTVLDGCPEGLFCNSAHRCVAPQNCGVSTESDCVVASTVASGTPVDTMIARTGIVALAADETHLYWLDYGTYDSLGNYQDNGTLKAFAFEDKKTTTIASGLSGPVQLGVTGSHAYLHLDRPSFVGSPMRPAIVRIPLAGGAVELVQDGGHFGQRANGNAFYCVGCFGHSGERAFWTDELKVYSMGQAAGEKPSLVLDSGGMLLASDGTNLFYANGAWLGGSTGVWRTPIAGGTPELLVSPMLVFALGADALYGIEEINNGTGLMLDRAPLANGSWKRIRGLGSGGLVSRLQLVGDRFFLDEHPGDAFGGTDVNTIEVLTGLLSSEAPPVRLLKRAALQNMIDYLWVGSANALYWSDGHAIYSRSVTP